MLVRRNHVVPVLRNEYGLDRLFGDLFGELPGGALEAGRVPAVNTWEDEKSFHVEAEMPGLSPKEIDISVIGDELRIAGGIEREKSDDGKQYHRRERYTGSFSRMIRFPSDVDADKVDAKYENGVLRIALPKATASLPRKVEIKG